ncbi:Leukemia inhibitory factor receptor [Bagarius yarrelli]|uniref:Leukemia inhibitory factor receptor n=1 Tax=Bagarius yarrelli TaxID=175774 RepID=A0A556TYC9_BAGYA|nr:Leukemia inhibitory factor receptor [Bagarius yarrelli]
MTAFATAMSGDRKRCAFAKFSRHPEEIIQCGPPSNVTFTRSYGHLNVLAEWDDRNVNQYYLRYREHNAAAWKEVMSQNSRDCTVGDLVSSQSYEMQIQCFMTSACPQCPFSTIIRVPEELTEVPVIIKTCYDLDQTGRRKITVQWKYVHSDATDVYNVTIQKASGDPAEESSYFLRGQSVTLYLCFSAYKLSISALNKAGASPAARLDIVEELRVAFQPYKRYHFFLHARHEKDTCNLKTVNNSDQTLGWSQVYLTEGTPITAPGNVSGYSVTQNSFVITWSPVPEEDLRGFLQGYIIQYTQDNSTNDITVPPSMNSYKLLNLHSGSIYCVQVSAHTAAGDGKWSEPKCFDTLDSVAVGGLLVGVVAGVLVLLLATNLCFHILKRSKKLLWPSIPNPNNSNAVQKIEGGQDLDIMELLSRSYLEETEEHVSVLEAKKDTNSACNVSQDGNKASLTCYLSSPSLENNEPPSFPTSLTTVVFTPTDTFPTDSFHKDSPEDSPADPPSVLNPASVSTAVVNPTGAFISDYTTMELFKQINNSVPATPPGSGAATTPLRQEYLSQSQLLIKSSDL